MNSQVHDTLLKGISGAWSQLSARQRAKLSQNLTHSRTANLQFAYHACHEALNPGRRNEPSIGRCNLPQQASPGRRRVTVPLTPSAGVTQSYHSLLTGRFQEPAPSPCPLGLGLDTCGFWCLYSSKISISPSVALQLQHATSTPGHKLPSMLIVSLAVQKPQPVASAPFSWHQYVI